MYTIVQTKKYVKSLKRLARSGRFPKQEIEYVIDCLANNEILSLKYKDHPLKGDLSEYRECHILPDLLLVYKKEEYLLFLILVEIGSHSYLF